MTHTLDISHRAFFGTEEKPQEFQALLHTCLDRRRSLRAVLAADHVTLEIPESSTTSEDLQLGGTWRSPDFQNIDNDNVAAKLLLPFLFEISEIGLSHSQIYTLGHSYRPLSDFFMRNLLLAINRNVPVICTTKHTRDKAMHGIRNFQRQYFYILKSIFPEPELEERNSAEAVDFIMANTYFPVLSFKNPLLQHGGQYLRDSIFCDRAQAGRLKLQLLDARETVLAHFAK
jgi:hypothetical protein